MLKRRYHWLTQKDGCHQFANERLALAERAQESYFPVFLHLRATNLAGNQSFMRNGKAQTRRLLRSATKYERKRQRRRAEAASSRDRSATSTAQAGQISR